LLNLPPKQSENMENINNKHRKYLKIFWIIFISPLAFFFFLFFFIAMGWLGFMPTFEDLENPQRSLASEVYSADEKILGTIYQKENRNNIEYKDLSPYLIHALIAREDHRFSKHSGIDGIGLMRVIGKTILLSRTGEGGGSTITQQLARNLFPRDTTRYRWSFYKKTKLAVNKFKEWVIAVKLERNYSKDEILTMYLNTVNFGGESYGIKAASRNFYSKSPDSLKIEEAAVLIGMLQATTAFNPKRNPERSKIRRNSVLKKMAEHEFITQAQYDSISGIPIVLKYQPQSYDAGSATYFREYLRITMTRPKPLKKDYNSPLQFKNDSLRWANDPLYGWCHKNLKPDGTPYNLYKDGLKIYSTIDSKMQVYAEEAMTEHLSKTLQPKFYKESKNNKRAPFFNTLTEDEVQHRLSVAMRQTSRYWSMYNAGYSKEEIIKSFKTPAEMRVFSWKGDIDTIMTPWDSIRYYKFFFRSSFMAMDPKTGNVKAYIGGPSLRHFKYDGVTQQKRQVGSTIKPFLYTLAMQNGFKPCDLAPNTSVTFDLGNDSIWEPRNSGESQYDGKMVTLRWGLSQSSNFISAWLVKQFNPQAVVDLMKKMEIHSELLPVPSIILGTSEISLYDMVGAYSIFANKGVYSQPIFITRIEDKNGNVIANFQSQKIEVINEKTAHLMCQMLKFVVQHGTGLRLRQYDISSIDKFGGKTGTTQNHADGWFMSISPDLVTGTWVGFEELNIHFKNIADGQGSAMALPITGLFLQKLDKDKSILINQTDFERPEGFDVNFDCPMSKMDEEKNESSALELF
jgi:penicillin-binding protein 1A